MANQIFPIMSYLPIHHPYATTANYKPPLYSHFSSLEVWNNAYDYNS